MDGIAVLTIIVVLIFIGVPLLIVTLQVRRSRGMETRWHQLGWQTSAIKQPVRFANVHRMKRFRTRWIQHADIEGAITVGGKNNYSDSGSSTSTRTALFIANPFTGPSLREVVTSESTDNEFSRADGVDFGDTQALSKQAWDNLRPFVEQNPPPQLYNLQISRYWLFFLTWLDNPGPAEALAQIDYLHDVSLAVQGKPTSGINHKAALTEARKADAIKWYKKDAYAAAARTDTGVANKRGNA